jgi:hypothetical protein
LPALLNITRKLAQQPLTGPLLLALLAAAGVYLLTLQTIPNGSSHYFMIDVGEAQIVLNIWGTLHFTGYPLYVMLGNLLTDLLTAVGVSAITAPAVVSLLWGLLTLALIGVLAHHLTGRAWLAAGITLLFALTRTWWIHNNIAEVYSFGLLLLAALLNVALWRQPITGRIYWLALLGGLAVAHHRAVVTSIPALVFAVWPEMTADRRRLPRLLLISLLLGLLGLIQYGYLYLRGVAGAAWVYGQPGTLPGLIAEFFGTEASHFIGPPDSLAALLENFRMVTDTILRDVTLPGLILGLVGLLLALRSQRHRRASIVLILNALGAYSFHVLLYRDILSALILPITLSLAFGWLFLGDALLSANRSRRALPAALTLIVLAGAVGLFALNIGFIRSLTTDPSGLETIELLRAAPPDSTVMLAWGTRYFAAAIGQTLLGELDSITLIDDKADLAAVARQGRLITPEYTFYQQPPDWWQQRIGQPIYLQAAAPYLVEINLSPSIIDAPPAGITTAQEKLHCDAERVVLEVVWQTDSVPPADWSVFVKAFDAAGALIGQGDQFAPVYGWRPLTTWAAGEQVRDFYPVAAAPEQIARLSYGLYRALPDGSFENLAEWDAALNCSPPLPARG